MRSEADAEKIRRLVRSLGRAARGPGRVYLTGGTSAVLIGWRGSTIDADLRLDPEPAGAFEAIARIKDELDVNVELASPADFVPVPPDWRERSVFIESVGRVDFFHFDFRAQALAKIERGHERDLSDVEQMIAHGLVDPGALAEVFERIREELVRYPAIDEAAFRAKLDAFLDRTRRRGSP
ncbi:MAG: DUF6036 family nucleotidyltransferase [Planctomycetota bacterium JB042]